ncbi:MAG: hypothetical protein Q9225_007580, partial [Loekoesia sp. 1 TL-2023]
FHYAALSANIEILNILWAAKLKAENIESLLNNRDKFGLTAMDCILRRKNWNGKWSKLVQNEPDEDPLEFYRAFKLLIRDIFERSTGKTAAFRWVDDEFVVVASETSLDEADPSEGENFYEFWPRDGDEDDDVHTTDEEGSEKNEEDSNPEDEKDEEDEGDEGDNEDEEVWEDAPESLPHSTS